MMIKRTCSLSSLWLLLFALVTLFSCQKKGLDEITTGFISGLGSTPGALKGEKLELPKGISVVGEIKGYDGGKDFSPLEIRPQPLSETFSVGEKRVALRFGGDAVTPDIVLGSGVSVRLLVTFQNVKKEDVKVTIPACAIFPSKSAEYQHGILIKEVTFTIKANSKMPVVFHTYCGNYSRSGSSGHSLYEWAIVSKEPRLEDLAKRVADKKINIEEFDISVEGELAIYINQSESVQKLVWRITDEGALLTNEDLEFIKSLPNSKGR